MQKFKKLTALFTALVISAGLFGATVQAAPVPTLDVSYLTLAPGSDATQLTFSWQTSEIGEPVVRIWKDGGAAMEFTGVSGMSASSISGMYYNRVTVSGLEADSAYTYQLGDGSGDWSAEYSVKTENPASFSYIVVGDPQIGASGNASNDTADWVNTMNVIESNFPDAAFMMGTGDQINTTPGTVQEYTGFFTPPQMSSLPFANCMGNHEGANTSDFGFYNAPNADGSDNYWYRYGDTLFMVWNVNYGIPNDMDAFLSGAIAANPDAAWKILTFHYDVYGQGSPHSQSDAKNYRDQYVSTIDKFGIDVVFTGHDHAYSRSYPMIYSGSASTSNAQGIQPETLDPSGAYIVPSGTVYYTINSSTGSKYYALLAQQPYTAFMAQNNLPMFCVVNMTGGSFTCVTYQVNADDSLTEIDAYSIVKPADYSAVDAAIAAANALDGELYANFNAVDAAVAAVQYGLDISNQAEVNAFAADINNAITALKLKVIGAAASASVEKLAGNRNNLTITVTERLADGTVNAVTATFGIGNNAAGTYEVGGYNVYVDTKGNDQIRACNILNY